MHNHINLVKYAKICNINFCISTVWSMKRICIESDLKYAASWERCKCIKFRSLVIMNNIMFWLLLYSSSNLKIKLFVSKNYTYFIIFLKMNKPAISKRSQLILQNTSSVVTKKAKYYRQLNFESIPKKLETDKGSHYFLNII